MPFQTNIYSVLLFMSILCSWNVCAQSQWQQLKPGIEYQHLEVGFLTPWSQVHVFRIDLQKNKMELLTAKSLSIKNASAEEFAKRGHALLSMNGGFFDESSHPLGLRINNQLLENPLKRISWWGIFYIKNNTAHISSLKQFKPSNDIELALQSGPRLLVNKKIPSLKAGKNDRSALGITAEGKVILLVSTNAPMTTRMLAQLMRAPPLSCTQAINLDGGSSSQLYAHINSFKLNVPGFSNVSDAIVVKPLG